MPIRPLALVAAALMPAVALAANTLPGLSNHQSPPAPPARGGIELAAPAQTCPPGFQVTQSSIFVYQCRFFAPGNTAPGHAYVASQKPCDAPRYWNLGPKVLIVPVRGGGHVQWTCRHL